ncbi:MAG: hypothetical protein IIY78_05940 [Clostridia bacterium]|nr:hypothetical protein [Clostridia bacterium]
MSYYKIKCVYCLESIPSYNVVYRLNANDLEFGYTERDSDDYDVGDDNLVGNAMTGMGGGNDMFSSGSDSSSNSQFVNGADLQKHAEAVKVINAAGLKLPKYVGDQENIEKGALAMGYEVKGLKIGNKLYDGKILKRYCPFCHKRLLAESGTIPVFTVAMIGNSTAGKTVFLTMQAYEYIHGNYDTNVHKGKIIVNWIDSHLDANETDVIYQTAAKFADTGEFPSTTQVIPPPHCLKVSYRPVEGGKVGDENTTTCIMCFRDAIGELFTQTGEQTSSENYQRTVQICQRVDGLMVLNDPFALTYVRKQLPDVVGRSRDMTAQVAMSATVQKIFSLIAENAAVKKPTVCLMTKSDELVTYGEKLGINPNSPVVARNFNVKYFSGIQGRNWAKDVYNRLLMNTRSVLQKLDQGGNWMSTIDQFFSSAAHIPVSSVGSDVRILDIDVRTNGGVRKVKRIVTIKQYEDYLNAKNDEERFKLAKSIISSPVPAEDVNPRFLELPLLTFLMKFDMLPAMYDETYNVQPDANYDIWFNSCSMQFSEKEGAITSDKPVYVEKVKKPSVFSRLFGGGSKK